MSKLCYKIINKKKILYLGIDIIRYVLYFACFIFSSGSFKTTIAIYQIILSQLESITLEILHLGIIILL